MPFPARIWLAILLTAFTAGCYKFNPSEYHPDANGGANDAAPPVDADAANLIGVVDADAKEGTNDAIPPANADAANALVVADSGVDAAGATLITSFSSAATAVSAGQRTNLTATFTEGNGVITPSTGPSIPVSSGIPVSTGPLNATTTYTLTVTTDAGPVSTAILTVSVPPTPTTLVSGLSASGFALDSANLYFLGSFRDSYGLFRVALSGGDATLLSANAQGRAAATDGTSVYWTNYDYASATGSVMKVAVTGGSPFMLASGPYQPSAIATDGTFVYWCNSNNAVDAGVTPQNGTGSVMKVAITGSNATTLADQQDQTDAIAIDATSVYWNGKSSVNGGSLSKVALTGGKIISLAVGLPAIGPITVNPTGLYASATMLTGGFFSGASVIKVALEGGAPVTVTPVGVNSSSITAIAVDDASIYWVVNNSIMKMAIAGGPAITLALFLQGMGGGRNLAVDGTSVYWTADSGANYDGAILKAAK